MDSLYSVIDGTGRAEPSPSYAEALTAFLERLNAAEVERYTRSYPNSTPPTYVIAGRGRKYDRVVRIFGNGLSGGAFCFVEKNVGTIWKPASYKGPEKNFPRGSVFALPERLPAAREDSILHAVEARA